MSILPDVPRRSAMRSKVADCIFVLLFMCSRITFVAGGIAGAIIHGFSGCMAGVIAGGIMGFFMGRSLGLRSRNLTQGYHLRMHERGLGKPAGTLEAFVELVRGNRLSMLQCRNIACAYAEAARELQSCYSPEDRKPIIETRNRKILAAFYGEIAVRPSEEMIGVIDSKLEIGAR
ncbi:MAG TPA: hypothetical protein VN873_07195 [Candidatus Angelobacter sp.]|nr:hypothetical protein [Candidatus Angelobacter sp.]